MTKGRPRKSRDTKQAEGTLRPDRDYVPPVVGDRGVGDPPEWLPEDAREVWVDLAGELEASGIVRSVDAGMFAQLCLAVTFAHRAAEQVPKKITHKQPSGRVARHPSVDAWVATVGVARQLAEHFGVTPAARARLGISQKTVTPGAALVERYGASPRHLRAVDGE